MCRVSACDRFYCLSNKIQTNCLVFQIVEIHCRFSIINTKKSMSFVKVEVISKVTDKIMRITSQLYHKTCSLIIMYTCMNTSVLFLMKFVPTFKAPQLKFI